MLLLLSTLAFAGKSEPLQVYLNDQQKISTERLYQNISRSDTLPGIVVASPSKAEPNYYYHWVRDAALVMDLVRWQMTDTDNPARVQFLEKTMFTWAALVRKLQNTPNMSGGPGEPKFNVDGSAYNHPWGRPQNDGPALRALTLTRFAHYLMATGRNGYVQTQLYSGKMPARGIIKRDLEYVAHSIHSSDFDPWEEVRGFHFYNRMVQRKALVEGAKLAKMLGDEGAAKFYMERAELLEEYISSHWDPKKKIFVATLGRDGGADYKHTGIDISVILGVNHSGADDFIALEDERLVSTAHILRRTFQGLYPVNKNGLPGTLIGRYPEDKYDGNGFSEGHGWVLTTHALAEYYYRLAQKLQIVGSLKVSDLTFSFYKDKLMEANSQNTNLSVGTFSKDSGVFKRVVASLIQSADNLMARVKYHTPADGSFAEQINRHTGFMRGAPNLTWSYASFLTALRERSKL